MNNIVFILGAGASHHCGGPLMSDFLDIAKDLYLTGKITAKSERESFELVFQKIGDLQSVFSKANLDNTNIESIFSAFEFANTIKKLPGTNSADIPNVIKALKEVIIFTLEAVINYDYREEESLPVASDEYLKFAYFVRHLRESSNPKYNVSVITFNYDIAVDLALEQSGMKVNYAFDDSDHRDNLVYLHKLHGSLNWFKRNGENNISQLYPGNLLEMYKNGNNRELLKYRNDKNMIHVPTNYLIREYCKNLSHLDKDPKFEQVIIPPSLNKISHYQQITNVWERAAQRLGEADYIFIIGYSFPENDAFFKYLYALGTVGKRELRKIVIYNPEDKKGEVDRRFQSLIGLGALKRYEYIEDKFEQLLVGASHIRQLFNIEPDGPKMWFG